MNVLKLKGKYFLWNKGWLDKLTFWLEGNSLTWPEFLWYGTKLKWDLHFLLAGNSWHDKKCIYMKQEIIFCEKSVTRQLKFWPTENKLTWEIFSQYPGEYPTLLFLQLITEQYSQFPYFPLSEDSFFSSQAQVWYRQGLPNFSHQLNHLIFPAPRRIFFFLPSELYWR